jgi:hypothetical protein
MPLHAERPVTGLRFAPRQNFAPMPGPRAAPAPGPAFRPGGGNGASVRGNGSMHR